MGGRGANPIFVHGKNVSFPIFPHFSPWGKMGKKVYGKRGKSIHFPLFPYTFFPTFSHGENGKRHNFPLGKNGVRPPRLYI